MHLHIKQHNRTATATSLITVKTVLTPPQMRLAAPTAIPSRAHIDKIMDSGVPHLMKDGVAPIMAAGGEVSE